MSLPKARVQGVVDRIFEGLGADAMVTDADGGAPYAARAIMRVRDLDGLAGVFAEPVLQTGRFIEVRVSEVADRPRRGAAIEILPGGMALAGVYPVTEEAQASDRYQLVWVCPVGEPQ